MSIFVSALSRTVCLEPYNAASWRVCSLLLFFASVPIALVCLKMKLNGVPSFILFNFSRSFDFLFVLLGTNWRVLISPLPPLSIGFSLRIRETWRVPIYLWFQIMRNLLGTHMGHFCLHTLCKMLQEENSYSDTGLVCGIIFNLNMALLANKPDFVISYVPSYILPSISRVSSIFTPLSLKNYLYLILC